MNLEYQHIPLYHSTRYPWPDDVECKTFTTVFSTQKYLPVIALASFPNSGSTWLRSLIEGLTGVFTGSFHKYGWNWVSGTVYDKKGIRIMECMLFNIASLLTQINTSALKLELSYLLQGISESLFLLIRA